MVTSNAVKIFWFTYQLSYTTCICNVYINVLSHFLFHKTGFSQGSPKVCKFGWWRRIQSNVIICILRTDLDIVATCMCMYICIYVFVHVQTHRLALHLMNIYTPKNHETINQIINSRGINHIPFIYLLSTKAYMTISLLTARVNLQN